MKISSSQVPSKQGVNDTNLVLIPKTKERPCAGEIRPIALYNVMYSLTNYALSLESFISPYRANFIIGGQILNNLVMTQELIQSVSSKNRSQNSSRSVQTCRRPTTGWSGSFSSRALSGSQACPNHLLSLSNPAFVPLALGSTLMV